MTPLVLLAAGGTGGHLFPAESLAVALEARGLLAEIATDARALRYGTPPEGRVMHAIPSETLRGKDPRAVGRFALQLGRGILASAALIRRRRPVVVVGFGGYPTVPPLLAAGLLGVPTLLHEQNVVMGRANRLLARRATLVATGFPKLLGAPKLRHPFVPVGTPVRPAVLARAAAPYTPPEEGGPIRLLVFGGSQGARVMADVVPAAVARLAPELRHRLRIVQQARAEDMERVAAAYRAAEVAADLAPFIQDMPERMAAAHLVIARAGASTVAELAVIGRPAILVPFPHALDQDQLANASVLGDRGAATVTLESSFTPEGLAADLEVRLGRSADLARAAAAAASLGIRDAADRLAELVLVLAAGRLPEAPAPGAGGPDMSQRLAAAEETR